MLHHEEAYFIGDPHDELCNMMAFGNSFRRVVHEGIAAALADCPKCHFHALERLHFAILKHGSDGKISVGDLAGVLREAPPGISRTLRTLEAEGLIVREADTLDRRKTFVWLSENGDAARRECENAVGDYLHAALQSFGSAHLRELMQEMKMLEAAMAEQTEKLTAARDKNANTI